MPQRPVTILAALAASACLAACGAGQETAAGAAQPPVSAVTGPAAKPVPRGDTGTIMSVVALHSREPTTGAGAVIGGVLGAVAGNQVGKGDGRNAATVIGAVGGAAVGNSVEKQHNTHVSGYRVDVRLDDGGTTAVTLPDAGGFTPGQRVRVVNGALRPA